MARAKAGRGAAAARNRVLARAQACENTEINNAIGRNPAYIQMLSLEASKAISKDPASKVYFVDGSGPSPLPLMQLGEPQKTEHRFRSRSDTDKSGSRVIGSRLSLERTVSIT